MALSNPNRSIIAGGDSVSGSLTINHPEIRGTTPYFFDDYALTGVTPSTPIRIALDSIFLDGYLEVLNAATGDLVADSNDFASDTTTYLSLFPVAGTSYIVRVSSAAYGPRIGDYTLRTLAPFTPPLIGSLALGGDNVIGSLSAADAQDPLSQKYSQDYELTGLTASVPVQVTLTGVDGFDTIVEIINKATGELIGFDDENAGGGSARYTFVPSAGITYLARATSYSAGSTGSFILSSALATGTTDLQMLSATAPTSTSLGSTISLSWTVKNNGTRSLEGFWGDAVILSLDQRRDRHDILFEDAAAYIDSPPEPGSTYTRSFSTSIELPDDVAPGDYYLLFVADAYRYIGESNENNNQIALPISISPAYIPGSITINGLNLGSTALGYALRSGSAAPIQIIFNGQNASANAPGGSWAAIAAAELNGDSYELFWYNTASKQGARWHLNGSGSLVAGAVLSAAELVAAETRLSADLDGDGTNGLVFSSSKTIGSVAFGASQLGYALTDGGNAAIHVTFGTQNASEGNPGQGWRAIAAAALNGGGYKLFWYNSSSKQGARWLLNSSGDLLTGAVLTPLEVFSTETALSFDLDKDGITGVPLLPITKVGEVTLGEITQGTAHYGFAVRRGQSAALPITIQDPTTLKDQIVSYSNPGTGWEPAAASSEGEGYKLYWHNHASNTYAVWNLSANASLITGTLLGGADVTAAERSLNIDISHNGVIGTL
ncbi:MAG: CARDB domain-containing protein [Cyanobium sp.]